MGIEDRELRFQAGNGCELRSVGEGEAEEKHIIGSGVVFNSRSELIGGMFVETIVPEATEGADLDDVRGLFNHDRNFVLGRTKSGTMTLSRSATSLNYDINAPRNTTIDHLVLQPIARRDVTGSSFAFSVAEDDWQMEGDILVRTIHRFKKLYDVSVVTYPAYPDTQASQRSLEAYRLAKEEKLHIKAKNQRAARQRFLDLINHIK